jgi:hypothetical protein
LFHVFGLLNIISPTICLSSEIVLKLLCLSKLVAKWFSKFLILYYYHILIQILWFVYIEIFHTITSASAKGVKYVTMKKCKNPCICVHLFANVRTFLRLSSQYISGTCFLPHGDEMTCKFGIINTKTCMCVCVMNLILPSCKLIPFLLSFSQSNRFVFELWMSQTWVSSLWLFYRQLWSHYVLTFY